MISIDAKYSCNASCGPMCRIFHEKHDWVKPVSGELLDKFDKLTIKDKYICDLCEKSCEGLTEFEKHLAIIHTPGQKEKSLERTKEIENHLQPSQCPDQSSEEIQCNQKETNENCRCNECGIIFEEVSDLKKHMENTHSGDNYKKSAKLKLHPCNFCHVDFEKLADFNYHIENNHVR